MMKQLTRDPYIETTTTHVFFQANKVTASSRYNCYISPHYPFTVCVCTYLIGTNINTSLTHCNISADKHFTQN